MEEDIEAPQFVSYDERYPLLKRYKQHPKPPRQTTTSSAQASTTSTQSTEQVDNEEESTTPKGGRNRAIWIILAIIVALIIIGVLIWYFLLRRPSTTGTGTTAAVLNESCGTSASCAVIFSCDSGVCKGILNGPCQKNSDCSQVGLPLVCTCGNPCPSNSGGQCKRPNSTSCGLGTDCLSGFCSSGQCAACTIAGDCQVNQQCISGKCS